jgi:hypothetical protein
MEKSSDCAILAPAAAATHPPLPHIYPEQLMQPLQCYLFNRI